MRPSDLPPGVTTAAIERSVDPESAIARDEAYGRAMAALNLPDDVPDARRTTMTTTDPPVAFLPTVAALAEVERRVRSTFMAAQEHEASAQARARDAYAEGNVEEGGDAHRDAMQAAGARVALGRLLGELKAMREAQERAARREQEETRAQWAKHRAEFAAVTARLTMERDGARRAAEVGARTIHEFEKERDALRSDLVAATHLVEQVRYAAGLDSYKSPEQVVAAITRLREERDEAQRLRAAAVLREEPTAGPPTFWIVWSHTGASPPGVRYTYHEDVVLARDRMAMEHQGQRFYVLRAESVAECSGLTVTTFANRPATDADEIPF